MIGSPDEMGTRQLIGALRKLPRETTWVEWKESFYDAERIGRYISGLANAAALEDKAVGYLIWGISDDGSVKGTNLDLGAKKVGNEDLENWLARQLEPSTAFSFTSVDYEGRRCIVMAVERAIYGPISFSGARYIRVGSHLVPLKDHRDKESALWLSLRRTPFEDGTALSRLSAGDIIAKLDVTSYFDLLKAPFPSGTDGIVEVLAADRMIKLADDGTWDITNLGAIALAKDLSAFPSLSRKAMRVIRYEGTNKASRAREWVSTRGYANGFEELIRYVIGQLPATEVIEVLRSDSPVFPEIAIRELVPNALVHQDFSVAGSGPTIEIFTNRLEVSNPGKPIIDPERFLDSPPISRNETLAGFMRRVNVCEERGTGIDKVVAEIELHQLPAPKFVAVGDATVTTLFAPRELRSMTAEDRSRACYWHAVFRYVEGDALTNSSLRIRLGLNDQQASRASGIIREALDSKRIRAVDPDAGSKAMRYIPWWA